ncbi:MAG TPA: FAD-dependent oxidoreductase, partial [Chloroflexota bacterium]|nr:FAD-dependent oxidoreductase [Chloroflexota bacterium]
MADEVAALANERYRLVIVGAGSGGLAAADFAVRLGVSVALIERGRVGGDCTWTGCVPSKALLHVAELAHTLRDARSLGVSDTHTGVDFEAAMAFVRQAIERVYRFETPEVLGRRGIMVIHGDARFVDAHTLDVAGRRIAGERILVATGAAPEIPPLEGLSDVHYLTYQTVFDLTELPGRLIVLGGGPVGVELAQAFQRLGSRVTLLDRHNRIAAMADPEASAILQRALERDGVLLKLAAQVDRVGRAAEGALFVHFGSERLTA